MFSHTSHMHLAMFTRLTLIGHAAQHLVGGKASDQIKECATTSQRFIVFVVGLCSPFDLCYQVKRP
jgi:hypothetical protein